MKPVRKAIFPVGGLGTRFLPATKAMPKEMLPVVDKPLIEYAVEEAMAAGIEEFVFVTGRGKSAIEDHFDKRSELLLTLEERGKLELMTSMLDAEPEPGQIAYVRQMEALGLGHAVWCARNFVNNEPFAVLLADDLVLGDKPTLAEMVEVYEQKGGSVIALMDVADEETQRYGIVDPGVDDGRIVEVLGLVEKPAPGSAPSNLAVVGRYILDPQVMNFLAAGTRGAGNEIQLTDSLAQLVGYSPFHGVRFSGTRFDCGTKVGFLEANVAFALQRPDMADEIRKRLRRLLADD